jgi:arylsulfatase A-like enzyme
MPDPPARVLLVGLDGFPHGAVSPDLTPRLWALGEQGGRAADGGRCALPSSTYPGFASLITGCLPARHGVRTTITSGPVAGLVPGWAGRRRVEVPTLFDACTAAGVSSAAIFGDHKLHEILATESAGRTWPPAGAVVPAGTPLDAHGYPTNLAVRPHLLAAAADRRLSFLFAHLNEADTFGHDLGPHHERTRACYAATDTLIGELLDAFTADWERSVVVVVSDHDMEPLSGHEPIDLLGFGWFCEIAADVHADGGSALVRLRAAIHAAEAQDALATIRIPGVAAWHVLGPGLLLAAAEPGCSFRSVHTARGGFHGGPATARTVAIVGGGHPAVNTIGAAIRGSAPHLADWTPTIAAVLGVEMSATDGRNLATTSASLVV